MEYVMKLEKEGKIPPNFIKWFMVESYLFDGKQNENTQNPIHWLSLTDPRIWIEKTEEFIRKMYEMLTDKVSRVPVPYSY
jgi:phospho-2-dehydro-3-deoxyheptonate aldolase